MEISIIELIVYSMVCYTGILAIIITAFRAENPGSSLIGAKVVWLIPSLICAVLLANAGTDISLDSGQTTTTTTNLNTTETWTETVSHQSNFTLQNPVWVSIHWLFFMILLIYIILNILSILLNVWKK